jgi:ABC-type dipeptide/oligopeptide/nickel transport system ATPase component
MSAQLTVENLWVRYPTPARVIEAVRGISFSLGREKLGIVGESGSGKSTVGRAILRLVPAPGQVQADRMAFGTKCRMTSWDDFSRAPWTRFPKTTAVSSSFERSKAWTRPTPRSIRPSVLKR